jgi:hypothetical protein
MITTALHHGTPEPDHAPHAEPNFDERFRERPPYARAAVGVIEINIGEALPMTGIAAPRPIMVRSHYE